MKRQIWELTDAGVHHRVEVTSDVGRTLRWYVDDDLAVEKKSMEDWSPSATRGWGHRAAPACTTTTLDGTRCSPRWAVWRWSSLPLVGAAILIPLLGLIPRLDLPSILWPDVDLPGWQLPGWVRWVLDHAKYVVPVIVAYAVARPEIRRRRQQHEQRGPTTS
ncbi:hypothetical protein [Nocardioides sp. InS609-2]|uniref:hypothetical protein n=1 Tax=Nocardioides sp. InS609-2 TaxID=2760705 RepID=UPI0020C09C9E|nr:hypothetical protein [Nocardioides sp. InS609-2]